MISPQAKPPRVNCRDCGVLGHLRERIEQRGGLLLCPNCIEIRIQESSALRRTVDRQDRDLRFLRSASSVFCVVIVAATVAFMAWFGRSLQAQAAHDRQAHRAYVVCDPGCDVTVARDGQRGFRADCECSRGGR